MFATLSFYEHKMFFFLSFFFLPGIKPALVEYETASGMFEFYKSVSFLEGRRKI